MFELTRTAFYPLIATPIVYYFLKYVLSVIEQKRKYKHIVGPDPGGIWGFLFGNGITIIEGEKNGITMAQIIKNQFDKYQTRILKFRLLNDTAIVTCDARLIKKVLIDFDSPKKEFAYKTLGFPGGMRFTGNGVLTELDYDKWRHKRSLLNPGFHKQVLKQFMKEFNEKGDILMKHLKEITEKNPDKSITLLDKFNRTALDVIASVAFSMNVDSINDPTNKFNVYIYEALDGLRHFYRDPLIYYKPQKWAYLNHYKQVLESIRKIGEKQIESRIEAYKNGDPLPDDILTTILKTHEKEEFSIENMVDEFVTFFLAGQETTANTLASAFLELGKYPDVLEKFRKEIDSELGSKAQIEYEDLHKLRYTSCVFKEALRICPPVAMVSRTCNTDIDIDSLIIPKGTWIMLQLYSSGRDEGYFPDPYLFKPERFLDENAINNYTYYPFSIGPRSCIGQNFAQIEAKVLIAKLIQNFDFKLDQNQSFEYTEVGTLRPKDGTKVFMNLRNSTQ